MTSQIPEIPEAWDNAMQHSPLFIRNWLDSLTEIHTTGVIGVSNKGASNLVSVGLLLFLTGRFIGTALLKQFAAHRLLGLYGAINTVLASPEGKAFVAEQGVQPNPGTPEDFGAFIRSESTRWTALAKAAGVKLE